VCSSDLAFLSRLPVQGVYPGEQVQLSGPHQHPSHAAGMDPRSVPCTALHTTCLPACCFQQLCGGAGKAGWLAGWPAGNRLPRRLTLPSALLAVALVSCVLQVSFTPSGCCSRTKRAGGCKQRHDAKYLGTEPALPTTLNGADDDAGSRMAQALFWHAAPASFAQLRRAKPASRHALMRPVALLSCLHCRCSAE
jgi:hypothetical protein